MFQVTRAYSEMLTESFVHFVDRFWSEVSLFSRIIIPSQDLILEIVFLFELEGLSISSEARVIASSTNS